MHELYEALEKGEELIQAENNEIDEMAGTREGRQKSVLLEKVSMHDIAESIKNIIWLNRN